MNHSQIDIPQTRHLLDLFYRGETTPEQERQLAQSLSEADPEALPDDLRAEQPMFADLLRIMPESERRISIPPRIAARLTDAIDRMTTPEPTNRRRRFTRLIRLTSAAAAVIVLGLIVFNFSKKNGSTPDRQELTAENPIATPSEADMNDTEAGQALRTATANNAEQYRPQRINSITPGNVVTITDPLQAKEITDKVNGILRRAAKSRENALNRLQSIEESTAQAEKSYNKTEPKQDQK